MFPFTDVNSEFEDDGSSGTGVWCSVVMPKGHSDVNFVESIVDAPQRSIAVSFLLRREQEALSGMRACPDRCRVVVPSCS